MKGISKEILDAVKGIAPGSKIARGWSRAGREKARDERRRLVSLKKKAKRRVQKRSRKKDRRK